MNIEFTTEEKVSITAAYTQYLLARGERGDVATEKELQVLFDGARGVVDDVNTQLRRWEPVVRRVAEMQLRYAARRAGELGRHAANERFLNGWGATDSRSVDPDTEDTELYDTVGVGKAGRTSDYTNKQT